MQNCTGKATHRLIPSSKVSNCNWAGQGAGPVVLRERQKGWELYSACGQAEESKYEAFIWRKFWSHGRKSGFMALFLIVPCSNRLAGTLKLIILCGLGSWFLPLSSLDLLQCPSPYFCPHPEWSSFAAFASDTRLTWLTQSCAEDTSHVRNKVYDCRRTYQLKH